MKTSEFKYRTFWPRFWAIVLDFIFLLVFGAVLSFLRWFLPHGNLVGYMSALIGTVYPFVYYILMHGFYGQTLGKMIMNVKLLHVDETRQISMKQAILRDIVPVTLLLVSEGLRFSTLLFDFTSVLSIVYVISATILSWANFLWLLTEIVTMLVNEKSRALHDLIAKTVVIRVKE